MKNIKIIMIFFNICFLMSICIPVNAETEKELDQSLYAKSALLMDADSGRILYEKNGYQSMKNASTTKILTCIVALEYGDMSQLCTVSEYAASMPKVHLGMKKDQQFILMDLLYSLMLESHNDSAVVIAESVAGDVVKFAELMNKKARQLGARNTTFVTPNGLDAERHETTAYDLAVITKYALGNDEFVKIINTPSYTFTDTTKEKQYNVYNKNMFLSTYDGAYGVKTGFTGGAGYCFVGASKKGNHNLISVVLASGWPPNKTYKWYDTMKLMNYGRKSFIVKKIKEKQSIQPIYIKRGRKDRLEVTYEPYKILVREDDNIEVQVDLPERAQAPIKKNQRLGYINVYINQVLEKKIPLKAKEEIKEVSFYYILEKVIKRYLFDVN